MTERGRDEILMDLLEGRLDPASEEAARLFAADPELEAELRDMRRLATALDVGAGFEREVVRESLREPTSGEIASTLATLRGAEATAGGARSLRWRWLAAAAAVLAAVLGSFFAFRGDRDPGPDVLGPVAELEPKGTVEAFGTFTWTSDGGEGTWFGVDVYSNADEDRGARVGGVERTSATTWTPIDTQAWPDEVLWTVTAYDPTGAQLGVGTAECSRAGD